MNFGQEALRRHVADRIRAARPAAAELSTSDDLLRFQQEVQADPGGTAVVCVVRRFDLAALVQGARDFAAGLAPEERPAWRHSFTRTLFLAGNPANLAGRFRFSHVTPDLAWTPPSTMDSLGPLRRLLKTFEGPRRLSASPGEGDGHELYVATAGVSVARSLVHLNHLLTEAVFDGVLGPDDPVSVRPVPWLGGAPGPFDALRIAGDPAAPGRLRAYAALKRREG